MSNSKVPFNRCIGLVVLDVNMSNPNGDPDMESDPRTIDTDNRGLITPVSFKRKLRDLVADKSSAFHAAAENLKLNLDDTATRKFEILEQRGRKRDEIKELDEKNFKNTYWDARIFGNTFLESLKDGDLTEKEKEKKAAGGYDHFIRTGAIQVGVGLSVEPVVVERMTMTNKAGVQEDKDRGMAPLGFRVVRHGIYTIPFFVNPSIAQKTGANLKDLELFKFLVPYSYQHTASAIRPQVTVLHAWFAEHKNPLGSCPDYKLIDALTPTKKEDVDIPTQKKDYNIPTDVPGDIRDRFEKIVDLCDVYA